MLFFIAPPRKALKPNSPPNNTPTATNMMIMRLVMNATPYDFSFSVCGFRGKALPLALPPSAAQRLEERRGVRVAHRLRLDQTDPCLFVLALRIEEREMARRAERELLDRLVEAFAHRSLDIRLRDADARVGLMKDRFCRPDVRPLAQEIRRQAQRKVLRQLERRKIELGQARFPRKLADEDRELITGLSERLFERWQVRARLRELRALRKYVRARNGADGELLLDQLELELLRFGDLARREDLLAQRRLAERGGGDVRGQRKIRGFELKALEVYSRMQRLEFAPRAARHVDGVGHVDRSVV